jgi:hypothetical protein
MHDADDDADNHDDDDAAGCCVRLMRHIFVFSFQVGHQTAIKRDPLKISLDEGDENHFSSRETQPMGPKSFSSVSAGRCRRWPCCVSLWGIKGLTYTAQ